MIFTPLLLMLFVPKGAVSLLRKLVVTIPLVLLLSGVVSMFVYAKHAERLTAQQDIDRQMSEQVGSLKQYMDHIAMYVYSINTFYQAEDQISRSKFHTFVQYMLQNNHDIVALEWIPRVRHADRAAFEAQARADGLSGFQFWEKTADNSKVAATARAEYFPLYYIEPFAPNAAAAGFDLGHVPNRYVFLQQTTDRNQLIVTPPIHLVQDPDGEYAINYYRAIFPPNVPLDTVQQRRAAVTGYAVAVMHVGATISSAINSSNLKGLHLYVDDITDPAHPLRLYDSLGLTSASSAHSIVSSARLNVGGRDWQLTFSTTADTLNRSSWALWAVLIGGMFFTGLFGALLLITTGRNDVVRRLVEQRTAELKKSEGHFELAITGASVGVWDWDIASGDMYWSPILNQIFGIRDPHFRPSFRYFESRIHPEDRDKTIAGFRRMLEHPAHKNTYDTEYRLRKDDGLYVWVYTHSHSLWDDHQAVRISGSVLDITTRKQAEQALRASEELLRSSMEHAPIGMALVSLQGHFLRVNKALCQLVGYSEAEVLALDFQAISHPDDLAVDADYVQQMLHHHIATYKMEKRYIHKDGHIVWTLLSVSLITDNEQQPLYFISQIQDISERKQADIVKQELLKKLTESNTELERFAYVASHDMNEPLRTIAGFSRLIAREYQDKLDQSGQHYIELITTSTQRIQTMVADLLEYARIGNDTSQFVPVDCNQELQQALVHLSTTIREQHAQISHDDLPQVQGNPVQLMRLLQNLLDNSLKYQPDGVTAQVHIGVVDQGDRWCFSIRDNGIGIQSKNLSQIFDPYKRLHSWQQYQGTGLGLAVCKKIVENHGGSIWATSETGQGSIFYFTLPK